MQEAGFNAGTLARTIGVNKNTVYSWLRGTEPGAFILADLVRALGTSPEYLLSMADGYAMDEYCARLQEWAEQAEDKGRAEAGFTAMPDTDGQPIDELAKPASIERWMMDEAWGLHEDEMLGESPLDLAHRIRALAQLNADAGLLYGEWRWLLCYHKPQGPAARKRNAQDAGYYLAVLKELREYTG